MISFASAGEFGAEGMIARHAAGCCDAVHAKSLGSAESFLHQHFDDGGLHAGAEIAKGLFVFKQGRMIAQEITDGSLEAAEAEIVICVIEQRAGEVVGFGVSVFREAINHRASGVGESHEFAGFVETFASSVVNRSAQNAMFQLGLNVNEHRVTAADDERDVGLKLIELCARRSVAVLCHSNGRMAMVSSITNAFRTCRIAVAGDGHTPAANPRRIEMCFVMMNADERFSQREGEGLPGFETNKQRGGQARSLRGGYGIQFRSGDARFIQCRACDGQEVP